MEQSPRLVCSGEENPDWNFARTKRILLRRSNSELMQSVYCARVGEFVSPNRDYSNEGFCGILEEGNWKFLDTVLFGLKAEKNFLRLEQRHAEVLPWKSTYCFDAFDDSKELGRFRAHYFLHEAQHPLLQIHFHAEFPFKHLVLVPLADIRSVYGASAAEQHSARVIEKNLVVARDGKKLFVSSPQATRIHLTRSVQHWAYKIGSGDRTEDASGVVFRKDERNLFQPAEIECVPKNDAVDLIACAGSKTNARSIASLREQAEGMEERKFGKILREYESYLKKSRKEFGEHHARALAARIYGLQNFSVAPLNAPDAGAMWFRETWWRDLFEGIYNNFPVYFRRRQWLKNVLLAALNSINAGAMPIKVSSEKVGNCADAPLLCFLTALKYLHYSRDEEIEKMVLRKGSEAIEAFKRRENAILAENGLLKTPANASWMDSVVSVEGKRVPARIPLEWRSFLSESECFEKNFYLAEVNALWIRFLRAFQKLCAEKELEELADKAEQSFKKTFFKNNFVSHIVHDSLGSSVEESSVEFECFFLLQDLFSKEELRKSLEHAEKTLFVWRGKKLFGAIVRNAGGRTFFGDTEYHGSVAWPRDAPYLIRFLLQLGEKELAKEILLSALEHQMQEGALFYNHELFSLPAGRNPSPTKEEFLPVPVKNPAQYWSQWVQPYFDYLDFV
jgi:glycogen debranching enzyme